VVAITRVDLAPAAVVAAGAAGVVCVVVQPAMTTPPMRRIQSRIMKCLKEPLISFSPCASIQIVFLINIISLFVLFS
jgi:hypothetical protein